MDKKLNDKINCLSSYHEIKTLNRKSKQNFSYALKVQSIYQYR